MSCVNLLYLLVLTVGHMTLNLAASRLGRVFTDHYSPDEGARPSGIREGDVGSLPDAESES